MSDLIDRQAAITTAVRAAVDWHKLANPQYSIAYCIGEAMRQLPPAQPDVPDINVGDTISRQQAIEEAKEWIEAVYCDHDEIRERTAIKHVINGIKELPPAQPESDSGRWERHYSRPGVYADLYWHCSKCGYKTDYQYAPVNHRYCPNCGRKMEREVTE